MKRATPTSLLWVIIHAVLFFTGILLFDNGFLIAHAGKAFAESIGGGLAATGAAGLFIYLYVKKSEALSRSMEMFAEGGLTDLFEGRAARIKDEYDRRLKKFSELDIIGFGLSSFREDYKEEFGRWSKNTKIRILLIDPDFPSGQQSFGAVRDREEGSHIGKIGADVKQFLAEYKSAVGVTKKFEVRLMTCTPTLNIFRIDREIFFGPYLMGQASRNSFTFICREGGYLYPRLKAHFDAIWTDNDLSRPIS